MDAPRRRNEMILLAMFLLGCIVNVSKALEQDALIRPTIQSIFEEEEKFERSLPPSANEDEYFAEMQDNGHMYKENKDTIDEMYQDDNIIGPNQLSQEIHKPITESESAMFLNEEGRRVQRPMSGNLKRVKHGLVRCIMFGCTTRAPPPNPPLCTLECPPSPPSCAWYCVVPPNPPSPENCPGPGPHPCPCPAPGTGSEARLNGPRPGSGLKLPCALSIYKPACYRPHPSECRETNSCSFPPCDPICPPPVCQKKCKAGRRQSKHRMAKQINCIPTCIPVPRPPPTPCREICTNPTPPCNPCPPCKRHCSLWACRCRCHVVAPGISCLSKKHSFYPCCTPCYDKK